MFSNARATKAVREVLENSLMKRPVSLSRTQGHAARTIAKLGVAFSVLPQTQHPGGPI
jgi:hypothetical protein